MTRERPCTTGESYGGGQPAPDDPFRSRARIERRVQVGRTVYWAICSADVDRVTLRSPRDIRTLVPSPSGRVVLAVYDGIFIDGGVELTPHLR